MLQAVCQIVSKKCSMRVWNCIKLSLKCSDLASAADHAYNYLLLVCHS